MTRSTSTYCGVLLIDKPKGLTSHDVVAKLRKKLGERRIGHAGTLDPMATGLLVVLVGEATKLEPYLSSSRKTYRAGVAFGKTTDTLDAEGTTTAEAPIPPELHAELNSAGARPLLDAALAAEVSREAQVPPAFSAIHVDGVRSHELARRGEAPELPPRPVRVVSLALIGASAEPPRVDVEMTVSKGYYVRSFARDLGDRFGCGAHLDALDRVASGTFDKADATSLDEPADVLRARLVPIVRAAASHLTTRALDEADVRRAERGQPLAIEGEGTPGELFALTDASGSRLVAIAERRESGLAVIRGFRSDVKGPPA